MKTRLTLLMLLAASVYQLDTLAQAVEKEESQKSNWWGDVPGMLNHQTKKTLEMIELVLEENPPQALESVNRKLALFSLDYILHDKNADHRNALHDFYHRRINNAAQQLSAEKVEAGVKIWKLYNHGFIVKTNTITIGFDLVRGETAGIPGFTLPDSIMKKIIDACDALFISHYHKDHADEQTASAFINSGKPVLAPPDLWTDIMEVKQLPRDENKVMKIRLRNTQELKVTTWPGHQGKNILNNVYVVTTPEGFTFVHTGDQNNADDLIKMDVIGKNNDVDILFVNCWTSGIIPLSRAVDPKLVITGHENELGHSVDHREPYWQTYQHLKNSPYRNLIMTWGESFLYQPE